MKKLFPGIVAMLMCFGFVAACGDNSGNTSSSTPGTSSENSSSSSSSVTVDPHEATLNDVKSYVHEQLIKKNFETRKDFTLINSFSFIGEDVKYDIAWSVDVAEGVTIVEGETEDTVVIGELAEDLPFVLTGTISDPEGCHSVQFTLEGLALKALSVIPEAITAAPVEGVAYKYHVYQSTLAKDMYFAGTMDGFYFKTTELSEEAVDVYVEYVAGSTTEFYPYFNHADDGKQYIGVRLSDDGAHDNIVYDSEPVTVFVWNAELGTITTHLDKNKNGQAADYYLGNYSTHDTISASMLSYAGGAGNNVGHLVTLVDKNSMTADKKVAEEKEKLTSIPTQVVGEKSVELIAKGSIYADVAIAWEVSGENAVIENGVLKLTTPATADVTVTLTATFTCGDVTDTKVFSILLKKYELPAANSEISIPKALEIGEILQSKTADKYYVSGTVTEVVNTQYGNLYIEDANGNKIYVYGVYDATGVNRYDAMANAPQVGDTVKLYSIVDCYNGTPQLKNAWVVESSSNTQAPEDSSSSEVPPADSSSSVESVPEDSSSSEAPVGPTTAVEIVNALYALADGESLTGNFTLTGVITVLDSYNNPTIVVEGMTDKPVYCYKLKDDSFVIGATITVSADSMKNYKGTYELMNCTLDSIVLPSTPAPDDSSSSEVPPADSSSEDIVAEYVTIDMMGTTNLQNRTAEQVTYAANGITYVNDKATSTTDCYDQQGTYAARAYKGSIITISANKTFTKVVFTLDDYQSGQYLVGFDGMDIAGATITRNNDVVTIAFSSAVSSFTTANLLAQIRIEKIEVCFGESSEVPPADSSSSEDVPPVDSSSSEDVPPADSSSSEEAPAMTPADIVNAAYSLAENTALDGTYTLTGVISYVDTAYNSQFSNVTVVMIVEGMTDKPIMCYRMKGTGADVIGKADVITVTGTLKNYNGKVEFDTGCTLDSYTLHVCSEYTEATCAKPETCVDCDEAKNDVLAGHNFVDGSCSVCGAPEGNVETITASKTMKELIASEGWTSSTTKQEFALDDVVTVKVNGGSNTGKAYDGDHIRIYATDTPAGTLTITLEDGYELVSIKVTTATGTYAFLCVDGSNTDISNVTTPVSGSSVVLNSVKNGSNGKQVRVMAIEVVYVKK